MGRSVEVQGTDGAFSGGALSLSLIALHAAVSACEGAGGGEVSAGYRPLIS